MPDSDGGGNDNRELFAERVIICTNVCESKNSEGKVVKCPDMDTKKCPESKDFDDSALPKKGLVEINHENLPSGLNRIHTLTVPPGGTCGG